MHIKLISPSENKTGVLLESSANGDDVEPILFQQFVRQLSVIDHADNADGQLVSKRLLDLDCEGCLVGRASVRMLSRVVAARADIQDVETFFGQNASELDGVVGSPRLRNVGRLLEPVSGGNAEEEWHVLGDDLACLLNKLDGKTGAVLEAATVVVFALVRDWREEGVDQVAVGLSQSQRGISPRSCVLLTPWISMASKPALRARLTDAAKAALKSLMSCEVISFGVACFSFHGMALGA